MTKTEANLNPKLKNVCLLDMPQLKRDINVLTSFQEKKLFITMDIIFFTQRHFLLLVFGGRKMEDSEQYFQHDEPSSPTSVDQIESTNIIVPNMGG